MSLLASASHTFAEIQSWNDHWLFNFCAIFGTVAAAIAGATASSRVRMDIFGVICCGVTASLGGGTIRDILLNGRTGPDGNPIQVYWVIPGGDSFLLWTVGTAVVIFFLSRILKRMPIGTLRIADTFALAFFSILGVYKASAAGCGWLVCIAMGICTGVAGGIIRDVLTGNVPYVLRPGELYATAAFAGSVLYLLLLELSCPMSVAYIIGILVIFGVRMAAVYLNWQLPSYRPLFEASPHDDEPADDVK